MKVKNSKIKNISPAFIDQELKPIDEHGYPIKQSRKCYFCKKEFILTFSFSRQNYSLRNFWWYWTEQESDKDKFIDNFCLRNLDSENKKQLTPRKKSHLSSYLGRGMLLN